MEVSKERMIELVKNAPEGAMFWGEYAEAYFTSEQVSSILQHGGRYSADFIKLDYSVLEDKPVYTQEMCDAGEFNPIVLTESDIGSKFNTLDGSIVIGVACSKFQFVTQDFDDIDHFNIHRLDGASMDYDANGNWCSCMNIISRVDTRTDQEKLIDDLAVLISSKDVLHNEIDAARSVANLIANSSEFKITRKGE